MNISFFAKLISRLVMIGALVAVVLYIFFSNHEGNDVENKEQEVQENTQPPTADGESPQATDGLGGKEKLHQPEIETASANALMALPKREWRKIQVIHLHHPENAGSVELTRSIEEIRTIYPEHVLVSTIDVSTKPEKLAEWRVSRAPAIVFQSEGERLTSLEEVWPKPRLTQKIEQLIHGLIRVNKDWRPDVKGLERR